jgi:hypothetical protein
MTEKIVLRAGELNPALGGVNPHNWPALAAAAMARMNGPPFLIGVVTIQASAAAQAGLVQFDIDPDGLDHAQIKAALR